MCAAGQNICTLQATLQAKNMHASCWPKMPAGREGRTIINEFPRLPDMPSRSGLLSTSSPSSLGGLPSGLSLLSSSVRDPSPSSGSALKSRAPSVLIMERGCYSIHARLPSCSTVVRSSPMGESPGSVDAPIQRKGTPKESRCRLSTPLRSHNCHRRFIIINHRDAF